MESPALIDDDDRVITLADIYKEYCTQEGCKTNSAVTKYLSNCTLNTIVTLRLVNNYLGPKGILPIISLVQRCQTLTTVDLEGNGIDNDAVIRLCSVSQDHLSLTALNLRHNPISMAGGKALLSLVEKNSRIMELCLEGTDIFETLLNRIQWIIGMNRTANSKKVWIEPTIGKPQEEVTYVSKFSSTRGRLPNVNHSKGKTTISTMKTKVAETENDTGATGSRVTVADPQPRSLLPSLPGSENMRLPQTQLELLRKKYAENARLYREVQRSAANEAANAVRSELAYIEKASNNSYPDKTAVKTTPMAAAPVASTVKIESREQKPTQFNAIHTWNDITVPPSQADRSTTEPDLMATAPPKFCPEEEKTAEEREQKPTDEALQTSQSPDAIQDLLDTDWRSKLSTDEQFHFLFNQGCREYAHRNLDGAYMAWNEAMSIATHKKNREWMSVLSSNFQRLSYEILVNEASEQLNRGNLKEADQSFELALEIATKARNAAWEADMRKGRSSVQDAFFRRCHDAALLLFEKAQQLPYQKLTPDNYFVVPGTDIIVQHTEAFVNEWQKMLLIKEAVEMWSEAARVAKKAGGIATSEALQNIVDEALDTVVCFLARNLFDEEEPQNTFCWQKTSQYSYYECVMLTELWSDLVSSSRHHAQHKLLECVAASQLANLYIATNQLTNAQSQCDQVLQLSQELDDILLKATGLTLSAIVNWHRANYAIAEKMLLESLTIWDLLRKQMAKRRQCADYTKDEKNHTRADNATPHDDSSTRINTSSVTNCGINGSSKLLYSIPLDHPTTMSHACYKYLISCIIQTYRYREAVETLEQSLIYLYKDTLFDKLSVNFTEKPTLDNIVAISKEIGSPIVYYFTSKRFDWSIEERKYHFEESVLMWVVPQCSELRFVEINVTKDFRIPSITTLIDAVRQGLHVDPFSKARGDTPSEIITTLHRKAWIEPLQALYSILMDPVLDFVRSLDPSFGMKNGVVTIIPVGKLWLIPFNALISRSGEFLIEDVALQMAFSATQNALASLSSQKVRQRGLQRDVIVVFPDTDPSDRPFFGVDFPLNPARSVEEGESIRKVLESTKVSSSIPSNLEIVTDSKTPNLLRNSEVVVENLDSLKRIAPRSRILHIAVPTISSLDNDDGTAGGILLPVSHDGGDVLRSSEISKMELFAEFVCLSQTNISTERVSGTREGVLCLIRSFFTAGVPCVLAGLWCTPDMKPSELFTVMYECQRKANRKSNRKSEMSNTTETANNAVSRNILFNSTEDSDEEESQGNTSNSAPCTHKAIALAKAIRSLLKEDTAYRYTPRAWAGYCCFGYGAS